jgi:tetratricopeptide (TPR) repeat protein
VSGVRAIVLALVVCVPAPRGLSAQCPDGSPPPCLFREVSLDTSRYLILPFAHREGSQATPLDGAGCAELLAEAFARWAEIRLADKTRIYDALARRGARVPFRIPFDTGLAIARQLGAGRLVMGQLWSFGDTLRLTAGLYDATRGGAAMREVTARVAASEGGMGAAFNALADSLLGADAGLMRGAGAAQTRSLRALRAYAQGERAMRSWDLAEATREFRAAIVADSQFAHAYLGLGQALLWAADSSTIAARDRAVIARETRELLAKLGTADRARLLAQQAMFEERWPDACTKYREILASDSTNFAAWYGLAECNAADPVVIRDPADSTRYIFRSSWYTAVRAYRRALLLAPSFNFFFGGGAAQRLTRILLAERYRWREGRLGAIPYFALPTLEADTIAFRAVSGAEMAHSGPRPPGHRAAVQRNRETLSEVTAAWVNAFPQEPQARRAMAYALEVGGKIVAARGEQQSALGEAGVAQRLERTPKERVRDAVMRIRLFVKAGDFESARRIGDSLLAAADRPTTGMAGVAVLLGRPALAARLFVADDSNFVPAAADNEPVSLPNSVALIGLRLLAYASAGAPRESILVFEGRAAQAVARLPAPTRSAARSALLDTPAELVFDVMGPRPTHRAPPSYDREMAMQWALHHGDSAFVRANLDTLLATTGPAPTADVLSSDAVYERAWLMLAIGDSSAAVRYIDGTLDDLPDLLSALLDYVPLAGALVRMMALRADLAAAQGETATARQLAQTVTTLWSGAEQPLHPVVDRMRRILAENK